MINRFWLHEFAMTCRAVTLQNFETTNNCILSTRLGVKVLEHYGVNARPQPVTVHAFNLEAWELAEKRVPVSEWPEAAWSVGIEGTGKSDPETRSWDGHLVLIVKNPSRTRTLIDLTADQLDRPHKHINVGGPVFLDLTGTWTPRDPLGTILDQQKGALGNPTIVLYRPQMTAGDWKDSPDWSSKHDLFDNMVRGVVKILGEAGPE